MATSETEKLQETIDELKERVERLEKENTKLKGKTSWEPRQGEDYYIIYGGEIRQCVNIAQTASDLAVAIGNCFKTRDEAKEFLEWLKARKTLLDDTNGFKPDWEDDEQLKFCVCCYSNYILGVDKWGTANQGQNIWFETEEDARESIREHAKEWHIYMGLPAKKDSDDE